MAAWRRNLLTGKCSGIPPGWEAPFRSRSAGSTGPLASEVTTPREGIPSTSRPRTPPRLRHVISNLPLATTASQKNRDNTQQHLRRARRGSHRRSETEVQNPAGHKLIWVRRFNVRIQKATTPRRSSLTQHLHDSSAAAQKRPRVTASHSNTTTHPVPLAATAGRQESEQQERCDAGEEKQRPSPPTPTTLVRKRGRDDLL
jgi:hypothetical protein